VIVSDTSKIATAVSESFIDVPLSRFQNPETEVLRC